MARIPVIMDEGLAYGFKGGGEYSVNVSELENRFEERDENWLYPKHRYDASFEDLNEKTQEDIIKMLHACRGRLHSIKMKDWNDFRIVEQPVQVLPGTSDPIQIYKIYQPDGWPAFSIRPIQAIDTRPESDPFIFLDDNGDPVAGSLDANTGIFTPVGLWGNGVYTLSCAFLVWVRLDNDDNQMTINAWRRHTVDVGLVEDPFEFLPANVPMSWIAP